MTRSPLVIEHVSGSHLFTLRHLSDGLSLEAVHLTSPYSVFVEGHASLVTELQWYLENFLDYPLPPQDVRASNMLNTLKSWGADVFSALFRRSEANSWIDNNNDIYVVSSDPYVLSWPWEAMFDAVSERYMACSHGVERRLHSLVSVQPEVIQLKKQLNILLVIARPFTVDVGYRAVAQPILDLVIAQQHIVSLNVLRPPTIDNLKQHLLCRPGHYQVVHFDGHGAFEDGAAAPDDCIQVAAEGVLLFEDGAGGPFRVTAHDIGEVLSQCQMPLVVINACQSATVNPSAGHPFASIAASLLASGVSNVVAMAYSLNVKAAQVFISSFYKTLLIEQSVSQSVRLGRNAMQADQERPSSKGAFPLEDWLVPVHYARGSLTFKSRAGGGFVSTGQSQSANSSPELPENVLVGRDSAILKIERALMSSPSCITIRGLGGIGKTALVRFVSGWLKLTGGVNRTIWLDFREMRSADHVLLAVGEQLSGQLFLTAPDRIAKLREDLSPRSVLVIWDNFESSHMTMSLRERSLILDILDAFHGTPSKVLLTSRAKEDWLGVVRQSEVLLHGLLGQERWRYADYLLRNLDLQLSHKDPQVEVLMEQLGGHPLAMRVIFPLLANMQASEITIALKDRLASKQLSTVRDELQMFAALDLVASPDSADGGVDFLQLLALHENIL